MNVLLALLPLAATGFWIWNCAQKKKLVIRHTILILEANKPNHLDGKVILEKLRYAHGIKTGSATLFKYLTKLVKDGCVASQEANRSISGYDKYQVCQYRIRPEGFMRYKALYNDPHCEL